MEASASSFSAMLALAAAMARCAASAAAFHSDARSKALASVARITACPWLTGSGGSRASARSSWAIASAPPAHVPQYQGAAFHRQRLPDGVLPAGMSATARSNRASERSSAPAR